MAQVLSLDELIDAEHEREELQEPDDGNWLTLGLQSVPEERTSRGFYDERSRDLVDLFAGR